MSTKKTNYSYIGIALILLVFGIIFVPKIIDRIKAGDIIRAESRSKNVSTNAEGFVSDLMYLEINGEAKKVPPFSFVDHLGNTITNKDYEGKVYIVEFFFTTWSGFFYYKSRN